MTASRTIRTALTGLLTVLLLAPHARAGAFLFAGEQWGVDVVTHPTGYTGSGGTLPVSVCIDPTSANAAQMVTSVQNIVATWNALAPTSPNLLFGSDNDIPPSQVDFQSVALHELGHCIGLAHVNLATESGLTEPDRNFTKSTDGADDVYGTDAGADGIRGSSDDARGDDVNLHWFRRIDNNPFLVGGIVDASTYARDTAFLPPGQTFAANADRNVSALLGAADTESVMQQGSFFDEDQRALAADDVATVRLGMSGLDMSAGTADDYVLQLSYGGLSSGCDVVLDFDDNQTGFAVCQVSGAFMSASHVRITAAHMYFNSGFSWYFNATPATTTTSSSTTSTTSSSSTSTSTTSSSTSSSSTSSSSSSSTVSTSTSTSTSSSSTSSSTSSTSSSSSSSTTTSVPTSSTATSTTSSSTSSSSSLSSTSSSSTVTSSSTTSTTVPSTSTSTSSTSTSTTSTSTSTTSLPPTSSTTTTSTSTSTAPTAASSSSTVTSTTTSTTTSTLALGECAPLPLSGCAAPARALLEMNDYRPGRERMRLLMHRFDPPLAPGQAGDPLAGDTTYSVCVYDGADRLVSTLVVDRAGDVCSGGRPCWTRIKGPGMRYADKQLDADGVRKFAVTTGGRDGGRISVKGKNSARRGRVHMPIGGAALLAGSASATVQVVTSNADCFGATLNRVRVSNGKMFKALRR